MIYNDILETIGSTPVVKLNSIGKDLECNLYAKIEMVNPGGSVKDRTAFRMIDQAEKEGLDKIFIEAGFEWREPGCSMCLGMNPDILSPGERCASTSNRNYEGRQGAGGRTHLVSPKMAAAAALHGQFVDIREL